MREKIAKKLEKIKKDGRFREIPEMQSGAGRFILKGERMLLNLGSNNYLGLSERKELVSEAVSAVQAFGCSSGASRVVTGNYSLYGDLERETAIFKNTEDALVINTGFTANLLIMSSLADRNTVVFSDKLNHASIIDGIRMSGAKHVRYRHNDMDDLALLMEKYSAVEDKILITDTVFSMDGDCADLVRIVELCREHGVFLIVDEAHATGVFGEGRGYAHHLGLASEIDLHMGTFSKALGSFGAYIAGDRLILDYLRNTGRAFIFTTSLPPAVIGADFAALSWVMNNPEAGGVLLEKSSDLRNVLQGMGFDTAESATQIIPVIIGGNEDTLRMRERLEELDIAVGAVRPPTVPEGSARLRLSMRLDLTEEDLDRIKDAFGRL
ncbi:aminotransferase class I/II-fold pyridoxal phosphate-dependent enzyme [Limisalsivibrio acetivorans]|uniref:aminotransferase class I/II-fold pyridoxal phosphate-dependent enzyme n=1 Tax=Limisalsivibrio acetivorans TaxID=1304888 RepID=UPI0003B4C584|nr:8-amino-7-oxononanoate synthase [Limisalsivibrio acetivorans]